MNGVGQLDELLTEALKGTPDGFGHMTRRSASLEDVAGETLLLRMFGYEAKVLIFRRMKSAERDILQCEEVVVTRHPVQITFTLISDVQSEIGYFQEARLRMRNGRYLADALDGSTENVIAFVNRRLDGAQIVEQVSVLLHLFVFVVEIVVVHVYHVGRWKDASTFRSQVHSFAPTVVSLILNVDRIADVDVDFVGVSGSKLVQTPVCGFGSTAHQLFAATRLCTR